MAWQPMVVNERLVFPPEDAEVEYKECAPGSSKELKVDLVKEVVAMANSGGGSIVLGISDHGALVGVDSLILTEASLRDTLSRYIGSAKIDLRVINREYHEKKIQIVEVEGVRSLIIFEKPGTYPVPGTKNQQNTAFSVGTIYCRNGSKSEPASNRFVESFIRRERQDESEAVISRLLKAARVPEGKHLVVTELAPEQVAGVRLDEHGVPIDPRAYDQIYPFRQKELIQELRRRGIQCNSYDIQCMKRVFDLESDVSLTHQNDHASRKYTNKCADEIEKFCKENPNWKNDVRKASFNDQQMTLGF